MTRQSSRIQQKAATRQRLVASAIAACAAHGPAALNTADVARRAGLAHGSVFVHFATREALLVEIITTFARELTDRLHALTRAGSSLEEALHVHVAAITECEDLYRAVLLDYPRMSADNRVAWIGIQSAVARHLGDAANHDPDGAGQWGADPALAFNTWLGLLHHYLVNRDLFVATGSVLDRHGDRLVAHFLRLLYPDRRQP